MLDEFDHLLQELKVDDASIHGGFFSDAHYPHPHHVNARIMAEQYKKIADSKQKSSDKGKDNGWAENVDEKDTEKKDTDEKENSKSSYKDLPNDVFMYKLLDSFGDDDDRIIIATTNNPNMVNPVLLRPGRFDMKLCLGYCSMDMFINITQKVFDVSTYLADRENIETINGILKLNITPLILINTLILSKSLEECIEKLSKQKQKRYNKRPDDEACS